MDEAAFPADDWWLASMSLSRFDVAFRDKLFTGLFKFIKEG